MLSWHCVSLLRVRSFSRLKHRMVNKVKRNLMERNVQCYHLGACLLGVEVEGMVPCGAVPSEVPAVVRDVLGR